MLGLTAGIVANTFVIVTSLIMSYRLRYMRAQLSNEGTANGFAEVVDTLFSSLWWRMA